ncbi:MAG TPA: hypothetical protein VGE74_25865 [Gemmata sp.]
MNRELQQAAARAWAAMDDRRSNLQRMVDQMAGDNRGPMPVGFALDMVQNVTGDRNDAVTALINVGCDWLDTQTQPGETGEVGDACMCDARILVTYLRGEYLEYAEVYRSHMLESCERAAHPLATQNDRRAAMGWMRWVEKAQSVMSKCRLIIAAAYPKELKGAPDQAA